MWIAETDIRLSAALMAARDEPWLQTDADFYAGRQLDRLTVREVINLIMRPS